MSTEASRKRKTPVSLGDTAVTPTLSVDPNREHSSPASVLLASLETDALVTILMSVERSLWPVENTQSATTALSAWEESSDGLRPEQLDQNGSDTSTSVTRSGNCATRINGRVLRSVKEDQPRPLSP